MNKSVIFLMLFWNLFIAMVGTQTYAQDKKLGIGGLNWKFESLGTNLTVKNNALQKIDPFRVSGKVISNEFSWERSKSHSFSRNTAYVPGAKSFNMDDINKAYVLKKTIWPRNALISVCWENPEDGTDQQRLLVENSIKDTWEKESALKFSGWEKCALGASGIHIRIEDSGPHVKVLGSHLNGMDDGMVLNFSFKNWSPSCQSKVNYCIRVIAIHEFGHAIGLAHEHNRDDKTSDCQEEPQGTDGDYKITVYDPDSIMNYCNSSWNNDGNLSQWDIFAVRLLYGEPSNTGS